MHVSGTVSAFERYYPLKLYRKTPHSCFLRFVVLHSIDLYKTNFSIIVFDPYLPYIISGSFKDQIS